MKARQLTASLRSFSPSTSVLQSRHTTLKSIRAFIQSDLKHRMFSDDYDDASSSNDTRYANDPYSDNWDTSIPDQGSQRTRTKERWRKMRREEEALGAYDEGRNPGWKDEHSRAVASDNWRIRGVDNSELQARTSWARAAQYKDHGGSMGLRRLPYNDRSNSPRRSPPPPAPLPSSPSPEYIATATCPSTSTSDAPRKLLILDLNGTLLVRASSRGAIYSRPYMPALRAYLFAEETCTWLDVMVWSSAQPHNVDRMVSRALYDEPPPLPRHPGEDDAKRWKGKLVAVWARDSLGLSTSDYSRKSATTKDLTKPWSSLPGDHSARTTLLLDDSPAKVRLQPHNHVCVSEYSLPTRDHDFELKRAGLLKAIEKVKVTSPVLHPRGSGTGVNNDAHAALSDTAEATSKVNLEGDSQMQQPDIVLSRSSVNLDYPITAAAPPNSESPPTPVAEDDSAAAPASQLAVNGAHSSPPPSLHSTTSALLYAKPSLKLTYKEPQPAASAIGAEAWHAQRQTPDETLLAVIGVLDALKFESNVAGWIRAGGLWAGRAPRLLSITPAKDSNVDPEAEADGAAASPERPPSPTDLEVQDLLSVERGNSPATSGDASATEATKEPVTRDMKRRRSDGPPSPDGEGSGSPKRARPSFDGHTNTESTASKADTNRAVKEIENGKDEDTFVIPGFRFTNSSSNANEVLPTGSDAETLGMRSTSVSEEPKIPGLTFDASASTTVMPSTSPADLLPVSSRPPSEKAGVLQTSLYAPADVPMWYEDPVTFAYWVQRGRDALRALSIQDDDGISMV